MEESVSQDKNYYRSLNLYIIITIIVVSVAPLILISAITRYYFQVFYREKVVNLLKVSLTRQGQSIQDFITERVGAIRVQAKSYSKEQLSEPDFIKERLFVLQEEYGCSLVDMGVVEEQGTQTAYIGPYKLLNANYSTAPWFQQAIKKDYYVSDIFTGLRGIPHFVIVARQESEGKKWFLKATIDFEALNSLVENFRVGSTGYTFLINKTGELQTKLPKDMIPSADVIQKLISAKPEAPNEVVLTEHSDPGGKDSLYLATSLKGPDWLLVYHQTSEEAYSALYSARLLAITTFLISIVGIVGVTIYLSTRIVNHISKAHQERQLMNEQLIEAGKLASLGEMAAGIAHEINNPVGIMIQEAGWMQDLLEEHETENKLDIDEFRRALSRIVTQGRRCKEITHKLLSFARKADHLTKEVQIKDLIEEVVALSEQRGRYSNIKIIKNFENTLPNVNVSPTEVQQVLMNIINNSMDAMETQGGEIAITTKAEGNAVVVDIADTGPGIPKSNLLKIFEPFFTTKPIGKGTGLGLSICYGIMKKMGGDITVESTLGEGTTFHVFFPKHGK